MASRTPPIFLWKETHPIWGFLSQWYMMHQKAVLFSDLEIASKRMAETSPEKTQALGRQVKNYNAETWIQNRERIVTEGSYNKFKFSLLEGTDMKKMLLDTGNRELVETSPVDRIWGVGFGEGEAENNRQDWGLNLLGKCLEKARERIREEEEGLR